MNGAPGFYGSIHISIAAINFSPARYNGNDYKSPSFMNLFITTRGRLITFSFPPKRRWTLCLDKGSQLLLEITFQGCSILF
ncbi:hypothetical protein CEXT_349181 [Caerostris extrusa]|uniref:Uncharacterized protein n=1 Tax=Caerostris extrusa TaxID=172846 RepID=A0AAV4S422_CAEEX|nr:hypothetical protein CEXT_349181 [Caerostris extrusa]